MGTSTHRPAQAFFSGRTSLNLPSRARGRQCSFAKAKGTGLTLGKWLNLKEPLFIYLQNKNDNSCLAELPYK